MLVRFRRGSGSIVFDTGFGLNVTVRGGLGRFSVDGAGGCCGLEEVGLSRGDVSETAVAILCRSEASGIRTCRRGGLLRCDRTRSGGN